MQRGLAPIYLLIGLGVVVILGVLYAFNFFIPISNNIPGYPHDLGEQKACTADAKQCPDGSYVGRTGPNCEFAACPNPTASASADTTNWKTYIDDKKNFQFQYPADWEVKVRQDSESRLNNLSPLNNVSINPINRKDDQSIEGTIGGIYLLSERPNFGGRPGFKKFDAEAINAYFNLSNTDVSLEDFKTQTVNGKTIITAYGGCCLDIGKKAFILDDEVFYIITLFDDNYYDLHFNKKLPIRNEKIFDQILATFKFN